MLDKGSISTDDLNDLGYNHPPRVIGDIRDAGIPIITGRGTSHSGKRMAVYSFGSPDDIQEGRVGGRSAFSKKFKAELLEYYGAEDRITGARLGERVLQIDHRIPYRVAGDIGLQDHDVRSFMLLDASSQRAKSWSCENCPNMSPGRRDVDVCRTCFWAFPEDYRHIATLQIRRTDIVWQDEFVPVHDKIKEMAAKEGLTIPELIRQLAAAKVSSA